MAVARGRGYISTCRKDNDIPNAKYDKRYDSHGHGQGKIQREAQGADVRSMPKDDSNRR